MSYERDIDTIFEKMSNEKQKQLVDSINQVLNNRWHPTHLDTNITDKKLKEFLNEYVRTDNEVFEEDLNVMEIRCPIEFLDKDAIIESDNDYEHLIDDLHLNTFILYEDDIDTLIEDGILIEINK